MFSEDFSTLKILGTKNHLTGIFTRVVCVPMEIFNCSYKPVFSSFQDINWFHPNDHIDIDCKCFLYLLKKYIQ